MADHDADRAPALVRALDVATSGVLVCDALDPDAGRRPLITYVNGSFERLFGRAARELIGVDVADMVGEAVEDVGARRALFAALRANTAHEATFTLRRHDGTSFRAEMRITPVHDDLGPFSGERGGDRRAQSGARPGHQRTTAGQSQVHAVLQGLRL